MCEQVLLIASEGELRDADLCWGHGGWQEPASREGLDWLTLARLLGWGVRLARQSIPPRQSDVRWIVVACDPRTLNEQSLAELAAWLESDPILVVACATWDSPFARLAGVCARPTRIAGKTLEWIGPGPARLWNCRNELDASRLELDRQATVWATINGQPLVVARRFGCGTLATVGMHPSASRDRDGAATALLKHMLICGSSRPVAWLDWSATLLLRMDDPGGAQNVFSRGWRYRKLCAFDWAAVGETLRRHNARLSIGYVAGWVDDGDATRGDLQVGSEHPPRVPGAVYPSPLVKYRDLAGHSPGSVYDYQDEFRGIQALRAARLGDVEMHGYTHMHPDTEAWAAAPDRYESWPATTWFRELGGAAQQVIDERNPAQHPLTLALASFRRFFQVSPTTLICPGDHWTKQALNHALNLGLQLISSYYLAIRHGNRFCWCQHVCAPYLDKPESVWFDAGLPVVGYFHDYELGVEGADWMTNWLDKWVGCGARRVIDFRELATALGRRIQVEQIGGHSRVEVTSEPGEPALVRPLTLGLHWPGASMPSTISILSGGHECALEVRQIAGGFGQICLPPRAPTFPSEATPTGVGEGESALKAL
jgi:hypothetical protein